MKGIKVFLKKEKYRKKEYGCERYKNFSEDEKQRLAEYGKRFSKI